MGQRGGAGGWVVWLENAYRFGFSNVGIPFQKPIQNGTSLAKPKSKPTATEYQFEKQITNNVFRSHGNDGAGGIGK